LKIATKVKLNELGLIFAVGVKSRCLNTEFGRVETGKNLHCYSSLLSSIIS